MICKAKSYLSTFNCEFNTVSNPFIPLNIEPFIKKTKGSKELYNVLVKNKCIPSGKKKWNELFDFDDHTWERIFKISFKSTKNTKLQWFLYRVVHHILTTNSFLFKIKLVGSPLCTLCNSEFETITHLLWECREVQQLFSNFEILLDALTIPFSFNKESLLFGLLKHDSRYNICDNEILLIIKQYIYRIRCQHKSLSLHGLINTLKDHYYVQVCIANKKGDFYKDQLEIRWGKWDRLFQFLNS